MSDQYGNVKGTGSLDGATPPKAHVLMVISLPFACLASLVAAVLAETMARLLLGGLGLLVAHIPRTLGIIQPGGTCETIVGGLIAVFAAALFSAVGGGIAGNVVFFAGKQGGNESSKTARRYAMAALVLVITAYAVLSAVGVIAAAPRVLTGPYQWLIWCRLAFLISLGAFANYGSIPDQTKAKGENMVETVATEEQE